MKPLHKGWLLAVLQVAIVCSLGAKLLYDRAYRPRVWIKVAPVDPDLPVRGRYLSLNLEVPAEGFSIRTVPSLYAKDKDGKPLMQEYTLPDRCDLVLRNGQLIAVANPEGKFWLRARQTDAGMMAVVSTQTAYFLPEHSPDPSRVRKGQELWVEATIPKKGPPRPVRLGVKEAGVLTPIAIQ